MPSDNDLSHLIAQEVAKQLPVAEVYKDGLSPATKEVGGFLADLAKNLRLILLPLQYGALLQDRFRNFIERSAQRVPTEHRVIPPPQILGPVLEAIRFEPEGSISDEAFSKLLSRAFDRERVGQAHPAFPGVLRALSEDELELLKRLERGLICVGFGLRRGDDILEMPREHLASGFPFLKHAAQALVYCEHIESLGLIRPLIGTEGSLTYDGLIPQLWTLRLSHFGQLFVAAVLAEA